MKFVLVNGRTAAQSTFTLADLIIGHHFAISASCQSPSACGERPLLPFCDVRVRPEAGIG